MNIKYLIRIAATTLGFASAVSAGTVTFYPSGSSGGDNDLNDLDHYVAVKWGINYTVPAGQTVNGATLTIKNIYNWQNEPNALFIHLLDSATTGVTYLPDTNGTNPNIVDYFLGQGILLTTFVDNTPGTVPELFTYAFSSAQLTTLNQYLANGNNFALAFDPDCHYYNDGVCLTLTTGPSNTPPVPDAGSTVALLGLALTGLAAIKRRFAA